MHQPQPAPDHEILHVSDTALMVAACRALETERPDGFVRDPFAAQLAGERGMAITRALPVPGMMSFGIGVRSHFMDEFVIDAVSNRGVRVVVSLGCGLDTRPWRLDLPAELRWIEVDFPKMLEYKAAHMAGAKPRCALEHLSADLNDPAQRRSIYAAAGVGPAMMITEGLLMYLHGATVESLAAETADGTGIVYWLSDITSPAFSRMIKMAVFTSIRNMQPEDHLDGVQILETLGRHGWRTAARGSYITDMGFAAERIQKMMASRPANAEPLTPPPPDDPTGVHIFGRAE
jgi:methyltransferase (TIGR00027 family)